MPALFTIDPIIDAIQHGHIILTPNQRLSGHTHTAYQSYQQNRGKKAWPSPNIYSLSTWLQKIWQQGIDKGLLTKTPYQLLATADEQCIWQMIAQNHSTEFIDTSTMMQAYQLLRLWKISLNNDEIMQSDYAHIAQFHQFAEIFQQYCQDQQVINQVDSIYLLEQLTDQLFMAQQNIILVAFDDLAPLHQDFLHSIDPKLRHFNPTIEPANSSLIAIKNPSMEYVEAAYFAKEKLASSSSDTIGIIVPELNTNRATIERVFRDIITPEYKLPFTPAEPPPFNISAGYPLTEAPLVKHAINILECQQTSLDSQKLIHLLHSRFSLFSSVKHAEKLSIIKTIERLHQPTLNQKLWLKIINNNSQQLAIAFKKSLAIANNINLRTTLHSLKNWLVIFNQQLTCFNWPGPQTLNSIEYQQLQHYLSTTKALSKLDKITPKLDYTQAISVLKNYLKEHIFQAEGAETRLHILGVLESAGLHFDHVWIMNLQASSWPKAPQPNMFLPIQLQRKYKLPKADHNRELSYTKIMTQRLLNSASKSLIISYSETIDDIKQQPSPLISHISTLSSLLTQRNNYEYTPWRTPQVALQTYHDDIGKTLATDKPILGGSNILTHQAQCAFKAYAIHRLQAKQTNPLQLGLSGLERGLLLHKSLENIYLHIKSHDQLTTLINDAKAYNAVVEASLKTAMSELKIEYELAFADTLWTLEENRLRQLVDILLLKEVKRPWFKIEAIEKSIAVNIGRLTINLRMDRIDRLADNSLVLIDYKTGNASINDWQGERLNQPQLPLYAVELAKQDCIDTIMFIQLNQQTASYKGLTQVPLIDNITALDKLSTRVDLPKQWHLLIEYWSRVLNQLANQFSDGHAMAIPKNAATCQQCHLSSVCRIKTLNHTQS